MNPPTIEELAEKWGDIEDKIPSVWPDYQEAARELANDIRHHWHIQHSELGRVIALVSGYTGTGLTEHLDSRFAFKWLYPNIVRYNNIVPDGISEDALKKMLADVENCRRNKTRKK